MVISHLDACCGGTPALEAAMKSLAEAAMKERGMVRFEILDQLPPRQNHARLYEEWASERDWVAHNLSQPVRTCSRSCRNISARRTTSVCTGWRIEEDE